MTKAPQAFRTISEVSETLDVPQHVLRFWEGKFPQIKPLKRAGGRRYYRPDDIELLRGIRALLYAEGYTIKGVQKLLRMSGVRYVCDLGRFGVARAGRTASDPGQELEHDRATPDDRRAERVIPPDRNHERDGDAEDLYRASLNEDLSPAGDEDGEDGVEDRDDADQGLTVRRAKLEAALKELLALRDMLKTARTRKADAA